MSRGFELEDGRDDGWQLRAAGQEAGRPRRPPVGAPRRAVDPRLRSTTLPDRSFGLPRGPQRELVQARGRSYRLRGSESHVLAAARLFRVVFERDLRETLFRDDPTRLTQDVKHLLRQGLLERHTVAADHRGHTVAVLSLTRDGQRLLERHRGFVVHPARGRAPAAFSG